MSDRLLTRMAIAFIFLACAGTGETPPAEDDRLVVLGPSLVELMHVCGLSGRIVGVDRYSLWPSLPDAEDVGGYLDPSLEGIASLRPTSIHIVGSNPDLDELAASIGIPVYRYRFDSLEDVFRSADSLSALYGGSADDFRLDLEMSLDSIADAVRERGASGSSVMIVVYREPGTSSMTIAGRGTFFDGLLEMMGCSLSAPSTGVWPVVSAEGVLELQPDVVICLFPGSADSLTTRQVETDYWTSLEFPAERVHCLFQPYLTIPGGRLGETAMRISECMPWR